MKNMNLKILNINSKNQNSLVCFNLCRRLFHRSIILNADNNTNNNNNNMVNQMELVNDQNNVVVIDNIALTQADGEDLRNFDDILELVRQDQPQLESESISALFGSETSSFAESFPNYDRNQTVSEVINSDLPAPFKDSNVFNELMTRFKDGGLQYSGFNNSNNFVKDVFNKMLEDGEGMSQLSNLNREFNLNTDTESGGIVRDSIVKVEGTKIVIDVGEASRHITRFLKFCSEHKTDLALSGLGSAATIMFYYKTSAALHAKLTKIDPKELAGLSDLSKTRVYQARNRQLTFFNTIGGVFVAASLYTISSTVSNYHHRRQKEAVVAKALEKASNSVTSLSFIPLIGRFTKFKNVKWLKYLIMFVLLTLLYFLKNYEVTKLFSIFWIIMGFNLVLSLFISYNAISILILLKNLQLVDLKIFKYLPKSIRKYLLDLIEISRSDTREINVFLKLYVKGILIATFYLVIFNILMFYIS